MPTAKPVVIMGAGPAGLTAAWELVRSGREVVVWEADPSYVGGISRTVQAEGYRFDIGGHLFQTESSEVNEFWRKVLPDDFIDCTIRRRLFHKGILLDDPLNPKKAGFKLGLATGLSCYWSFTSSQVKQISPVETLAQFLVNRFGRRLYEIFYRSYFEKITGLPCEETSARVAERFFKPLPEGKRSFPYPRHGPGQVWESTANRVLERGSNIFLDRKVQTVHWDETGVTHITGTNAAGEFFQQEGSNFLSSLPLRELLLSLDPPPPKEVAAAVKALRYRNLATVCVIVGRENVFPDTTISIHDTSVSVANIHNYKNWSPEMVGDAETTSLGLEYYGFDDGNTWNSTDFDLAQLAIREVVQLGLVKQSEVKDAFVVRTPKACPVYDLSYQQHLEVIRQWISLFANLQPLGRNGLHVYNYQDHSMVTAMLAVRNIQGSEFDCWKVDANAKYSPGTKG